MTENPVAFVFPAFVNEYPDDLLSDYPAFSSRFNLLLGIAAAIIDPELISFDVHSHNFLEDELRTQLISYIISCSYADVLKDNGIMPTFSAGYSMGIYAAAYESGSISYEDGLSLICNAFHLCSLVNRERCYGMGSIIGLNRNDLDLLIGDNRSEVKITNQNSGYSFILSGPLDQINNLLELARIEGALNTRLLTTTIPYHSLFLEKTREDFGNVLTGMAFHPPTTSLVSVIDQSVLKDENSVVKEIVRNLFTPLNWYQTQLKMQQFGVKTFIECGTGKALVKNAKFVEGNAHFLPVQKILSEKN
ncbi:MAG: hypothetical protein NTX61_11935 [Bacteroidetes bacterium]|nr:hypothetical protein [Bacteroidota bacterium]